MLQERAGESWPDLRLTGHRRRLPQSHSELQSVFPPCLPLPSPQLPLQAPVVVFVSAFLRVSGHSGSIKLGVLAPASPLTTKGKVEITGQRIPGSQDPTCPNVILTESRGSEELRRACHHPFGRLDHGLQRGCKASGPAYESTVHHYPSCACSQAHALACSSTLIGGCVVYAQSPTPFLGNRVFCYFPRDPWEVRSPACLYSLGRTGAALTYSQQ